MTTGAAGSAPILDAGLITLSLRDAPGLSSIKLSNTSREAIAGSIGFDRISDFLAASGATSGATGSAPTTRFVTWEQGATGGRAVIALDRTTAPQMIELFSRDVSDYLSAIMAPIATGEKLTRQQYLSLVTGIYGAEIAREIETAEITASINFPGVITSAQGASFSGSTARFRANLADLLTLEKPLVYEVRWAPLR
jgi:hypothetical protein